MVAIKLQDFFVILATLFSLGIYISLYLSYQNLIVLLLTVFLLAIVAGSYRHKYCSLILCCLLFLNLGSYLGYNNSMKKLEESIRPLYGKSLQLTVKIDARSLREFPEYDTANAQLIHQEGLANYQIPRNIKIKISWPKTKNQETPLKSCETLRFQGVVEKIIGFQNPSNIDVHQRNLIKNIIGKVTIKDPHYQILQLQQTSCLDYLQKIVDGHFKTLAEFIPENQLALLRTLTLRPDPQLPAEIYSEFSKTSLIHVICVSGMHLSIICVTVFKLLQLILKNDRVAALVAVLFSWLYISLTNMDLPVLRAGAVNTLLMLGFIINRQAFLPTIFASVVIVMLAYKPLFILDITFQLSFLATASLIFLTPELIIWSKKQGWNKYIAQPLAAILSVQLLILPVIINNFHQISLMLFFSNFFLLPVLQLSILMIFAASGLLYLVYPLGKVMLVLISVLLDLAIKVNALFANADWAVVYTGAIPQALFYLYYLSLAGSCISYFGLSEVPFWNKLHKTIFVSVIIYVLIFPAKGNNLAEVHFIDVAQGDACLIITKNGRSILIDSGGLEHSKLDIGEDVLVPYLHYYGVKTLDYLILSHNHFDHIAGSIAIAKQFPIKNIVLANPNAYANEIIQRLLFFSAKANIIFPKAGETYNLDNLILKILHTPPLTAVDENDCLVAQVSLDKYRLLFTGDINAEIEKTLVLEKNKNTLLKVAHHGSKNSTSREFLQASKPQIAMISVGRKNNFGHPHQDVLERLQAGNVKVFRTDLMGAVKITFTEDSMAVYNNVSESP